MNHHVMVAAVTALAGTLSQGHGQSGADAAVATGSLWWLGPASLAAVETPTVSAIAPRR